MQLLTYSCNISFAQLLCLTNAYVYIDVHDFFILISTLFGWRIIKLEGKEEHKSKSNCVLGAGDNQI